MTNFNPNTSMSLEDGQNLYEVKSHQAVQALAQMGFGNAPLPTIRTDSGSIPYQGQIPPNLPDLTDRDLGYYMGLISEWNNYVQQKLAETSAQFTKAKAVLEHVEAHLRIAYQIDENDKKRSNPERDDYMISDRRFVEAKSNSIYWDTLYTYLKAVANSAEQAFSAVSRRITQRGQEIDRGNRVGATTGQGNLPSMPVFGNRRS